MLSLPLLGRTAIGHSDFWQCPYKRHTGRDCPFCGLTRDLEDFVSLRWSHVRNPNAIFFMIVFILELGWRVSLLVRRANSAYVWRLDMLVHIVVAVTLAIHLFAWARDEPWFPRSVP